MADATTAGATIAPIEDTTAIADTSPVAGTSTAAIYAESTTQPNETLLVLMDKCVRKHLGTDNKTYYITPEYSGIPENLTFSFVVWLILILLFIIIRRWTLGRKSADATGEVCTDKLMLYFGWIPFIINLKDAHISQKCGPDALLYLVFQRYLIFYLGIICIVSVGVVLPVNYHGELIRDAAAFGRTTLGNLEANDPVLWVHAVVCLLYLLFALGLMRRLKRLYVASRKDEIRTRTLLFSNLPPKANTDKALVEYFRDHRLKHAKEIKRETFQETFIESFNFAYHVKRIQALFEERQRIHELRVLAEEHYGETGHKQMMWPKSCGCFCACFQMCCCQRVDAIEYYTLEEGRLTTAYHKLLSKVLTAPLDIAFVTFTSESMAQRVLHYMHQPCRTCKYNFKYYCKNCCTRHPYDVDLKACDAMYAPEPDDIYWANLAMPRVYWWLNAILINAVLVIILLIFTTPSVILNLLNEWEYQDKLPGLDSPAVVNIMPVILLFIFASLLPTIVWLTEGCIAHWTRSTEQKIVVIKVFIFLLLMKLILPSLGLTSAKALLLGGDIEWSCIFLPDNGAFFVNYIITVTFLGTAMQLLRVFDLLGLGCRLCMARSGAEREMAWKKFTSSSFSYGVQYAWVLVIFCMIVAYSVCVPLIVPFGLLYMLLKHFVDRHNLYYAYKPSKMSSEPHRRAINFVYTAAILLLFFMVAFTLLRSDELWAEGRAPGPAIFCCVILALSLVYVSARSIAGCYRSALKVVADIKDIEPALSGGDQNVYVPEVIMWGTTVDAIRRMPPMVTENDL